MKLERVSVEKPWGRRDLPQPFATTTTEPVGEIWFPDSTGQHPLLAKYIFTSERLSIQVHPDDDAARARGLASGKAECWLVLDAAPGATIGIGLSQPLTPDALRAASHSGEIVDLLDWRPVRRGDFFYVPPGTVHAIGAGVALVEIQQNADVTYRLYDYGRPRALHLDDGVAVASAIPYADPRARHINLDALPDESGFRLVDGPPFMLDLTTVRSGWVAPLSLLMPLVGTVTAAGQTATAGDCLAPAGPADWTLSPGGQLLIAQPARTAT